MALSDIADMSNSPSLLARISASAARQDRASDWARINMMTICATEGWDEKWAGAKTAADAANFNPDTGCRTDVISDQMIEQAVADLINTQSSSTVQQVS